MRAAHSVVRPLQAVPAPYPGERCLLCIAASTTFSMPLPLCAPPTLYRGGSKCHLLRTVASTACSVLQRAPPAPCCHERRLLHAAATLCTARFVLWPLRVPSAPYCGERHLLCTAASAACSVCCPLCIPATPSGARSLPWPLQAAPVLSCSKRRPLHAATAPSGALSEPRLASQRLGRAGVPGPADGDSTWDYI